MERAELMTEIKQLTDAIKAHHVNARQASARRRELILEAVNGGATDSEIAAVAGVSRQVVERIRNRRPRKPGY